MTFRGLFREDGLIYAHDFYAVSWERAEEYARDKGLYDLCKIVGMEACGIMIDFNNN